MKLYKPYDPKFLHHVLNIHIKKLSFYINRRVLLYLEFVMNKLVFTTRLLTSSVKEKSPIMYINKNSSLSAFFRRVTYLVLVTILKSEEETIL